MKARIISVLFAAFMMVGTLGAQNHWALKTNVLHDMTASPNLAIEWSFAQHWSVEAAGSVNMWDLPKGVKLKHIIVQPELRYWTCERFNGLFLNVHAIGGYLPSVGGFWDFSKYYHKLPNLKTFELRDAIMIGGGIGFGYDFILSRHWNLELEAGLGYVYTRGDEYSSDVLVLKGSIFDYAGPTKLAVTFSYIF